MITELDEAGFAFLAEMEGCVLHAYKDQIGVWTIGYGSTYYEDGTHVAENDPPITLQRAQELFKNTSVQYSKAVSLSTVPVLTQNQFNGLFSLCYNIGTGGFKNSTVLKLVNQGIGGEQLKEAFLMWTHANGQVLQDLVDRRIKEYELYSS